MRSLLLLLAKDERSVKFKEVRDVYIATLGEIDDITKSLAKKYYHDVEYDAIRNLVLDEGKRLMAVQPPRYARYGAK